MSNTDDFIIHYKIYFKDGSYYKFDDYKNIEIRNPNFFFIDLKLTNEDNFQTFPINVKEIQPKAIIKCFASGDKERIELDLGGNESEYNRI